MKTLKGIIPYTVFFMLVTAGTSSARIVKPQVVNGNTYTCYFLSQLDIFSTDIYFDEKGMVELSAYKGNGFYFTITTFFTGIYWALDQTIGIKKGDYLFLLSGNTKDPFITGIAILIYQYKEIYPAFFFGFRSVES